MRPSERRREFLTQEGYLIIRGFFSSGEIAEVAKAQDAHYRGESDSQPEFTWPAPRKCTARTRKHPYASFFLSPLAKLLRDGRLATLLQETANINSIRFWHDQLLYEEPRDQGTVNYHWHREESRWLTCQASQMITAWIPLTDFTHAMGPITIVPRGRDESSMKRMVLNAGDLVVFDAQILHGNPPNFGKRERRAVAAHFASADLRYQKSGNFSHVNERIVSKIEGVPNFRDERVCPLISSRDPKNTKSPRTTG